MKLTRVAACALSAALLLGTAAVPAFAASAVEEENCFGTYVMMNVPYSEFYDAAGVASADSVDAVSSATKSKTRAGNLASGSYHINADGTDITGVTAPVKVLTPWALEADKEVTDETTYDITVKLRGQEVTTTYTGADALFENPTYSWYKLDTEPAYYMTAWYNVFAKQWEFGKVKANTTTVEGVTVDTKLNGRHTDYELTVNGFELDTSANRVYGVVLTTDDGAEYGLRHVTEIWRGTELGFNADDAYYASIVGKTITTITYYTADGVYVLPVSVAIPTLPAVTE